MNVVENSPEAGKVVVNKDLGDELWLLALPYRSQLMRMRKVRPDAAFVTASFMATQYQAEIGQDIFVAGEKKPPTVLTSSYNPAPISVRQ